MAEATAGAYDKRWLEPHRPLEGRCLRVKVERREVDDALRGYAIEYWSDDPTANPGAPSGTVSHGRRLGPVETTEDLACALEWIAAHVRAGGDTPSHLTEIPDGDWTRPPGAS